MENIDELVRKEVSKNLEDDSGIKEVIMDMLKSKELLKIAPRNFIGTSSPGPLFYFGSQSTLKNILEKRINLRSYLSGSHEYGILERVHITNRGENSTRVCFEKGGNCRIPLGTKSEIDEFVARLSPRYMVEAGFNYNINSDKLEPRIGKEIKKITGDSLKSCLEEYFIKPCVRCPGYIRV